MEPVVASIPRERLHDKVTREIALGIIRGSIGKSESALSTEGDLCRHFNVSRTILREAVKVLAAKGLIEVRPKTGIRVRPRNEWNLVDPDLLSWLCEAGVDDLFVWDLCEVRAIVEPAAAELAASRASAEEIEELLHWYHLIEVNTDNEGARLEADRNFHSTIFTACHNVFLTQMNTTVGVALRATQQIGVHLPQVMEESVLAHKKVADAIARRDSAAARAAMERLIKQSTEHIHRVLHPDRA
ncbi:MAG: FadR family transcriptional regulator [Planctomycetes bacterium]|nr:FadR family transcriptional regulator [Planctomycetota bacterium]